MIPDGALRDLARLLGGARPSLRSVRVPCEVDPLAFVIGGWDILRPATYFSSPDGADIAGLGVAWQTRAEGAGRLGGVEKDMLGADVDVPTFVGFGFSARRPGAPWLDFSSAEGRVARATAVGGDEPMLAVTLAPDEDPGEILDALAAIDDGSSGEPAPADPEPVPSEAEWRRAVGEAVAAISSGDAKKVVLARAIRYDTSSDPRLVLPRLKSGGNASYIYAWSSGPWTMLGASPELLMRKRRGALTARPMAGTAPASAPDGLGDQKQVEEHGLVVTDMLERLRGVAGEVVAGVPEAVPAGDIVHLRSEISGVPSDGVNLLALAEAVHPTAAVGGVPTAEALKLIEQLERIERGWYSGAVGWMSPTGDGDLALAIRCGLLGPGVAWLFAGNGIVAGSDPDEELEETRPKFAAMQTALGASS